jgi:hypothetical protein
LQAVLEHGCAIEVAAVDPFVEQQPGHSVNKQPAEIDFALLKGLAPQIGAG